MHCRRLVATAPYFLQLFGFINAATLRPSQGSEVVVYEPHRGNNDAGPCNLTLPSAVEWQDGVAKSFGDWVDYNWKNYKVSNYSTFLDYMKGEFAPNAASSALMCDGVGTCTIGTCEIIAKDISQLDRQMAYYTFEQISNIHHTYQTIYQASNEAGEYFKAQHRRLVKSFSHAEDIQKAEVKRQAMQQMALSITTSVILTITAAVTASPWIMGLAGAVVTGGQAAAITAQVAKSRWKLGLIIAGLSGKLAEERASTADMNITGVPVINGAISLVGNMYLAGNAVSSLFLKAENILNNVDNWFEEVFVDLSHDSVQKVWRELYRIMEDEGIPGSTTLPELLKSGAFIYREKGIRQRLTRELERTYLAQAIGILWGVDRTYILDTNTQRNVPCEKDERGPSFNRVCLPEHADRVYWLYSIDRSKEKKKHERPTAVRGPAGLKKIMDQPDTYYNISKQEIIRSSIWMQERDGLKKDLMQIMPSLRKDLAEVGQQHRPSGIFHLPICRNPYGEAISPVGKRSHINKHYGSNYPCMCGDFEWTTGWSVGKDETPAFLESAGFLESKNWERTCRKSQGCRRGESSKYFDSCQAVRYRFKGRPDHGSPQKET